METDKDLEATWDGCLARHRKDIREELATAPSGWAPYGVFIDAVKDKARVLSVLDLRKVMARNGEPVNQLREPPGPGRIWMVLIGEGYYSTEAVPLSKLDEPVEMAN